MYSDSIANTKAKVELILEQQIERINNAMNFLNIWTDTHYVKTCKILEVLVKCVCVCACLCVNIQRQNV